MRIAYFDTIAGISGDMTLGAFVSAGVSIEALAREIAKLNLDGIELQAAHVARHGISAVKVDVIVSAPQRIKRHLRDILALISESTLSDRVKTCAKKIFMEIAQAEASIHNSSVDEIHFHEVGAIDSIVDIVGCSVCLDILTIDSVYSSPVRLGSGGFVKAEHGTLPLPAPATAEILRGYETVLTEIPYELTTPTGAAIIKALSSGTLQNDKMKFESIGYGAGERELTEIPNLLRVIIGELVRGDDHDEVIIVETNIDDMNPEICPFVIERLLAAGARDAYLVPVIMKKGRPGVLLSAIADNMTLDRIVKEVFSQTTTTGVRIHTVGRRKLHRDHRVVETSLGKVRMKAIVREGGEQLVPEFEECRRLAVERGMTLISVYALLEREVSAKE